MVLIMKDKQVLFFRQESFQLLVSSQCWEMIENAIFACFIKTINHNKLVSLIHIGP